MQHRVHAVVSALALVAVGCDDGVPDLDTEPVAQNIAEIIERVGPHAPLADCPVGEIRPLLIDTFELVDDDIVRQALAGSPSASTFDSSTQSGSFVACDLFADSGATGFYVIDAPADIESFTSEFIGKSSNGVTIDIDESRLFRGGRFFRVCVDDQDNPIAQSCEVDWLDENIMVGVFVSGEGAREVDVNDIEERFQYILPTLVERLSES